MLTNSPVRLDKAYRNHWNEKPVHGSGRAGSFGTCGCIAAELLGFWLTAKYLDFTHHAKQPGELRPLCRRANAGCLGSIFIELSGVDPLLIGDCLLSQ